MAPEQMHQENKEEKKMLLEEIGGEGATLLLRGAPPSRSRGLRKESLTEMEKNFGEEKADGGWRMERVGGSMFRPPSPFRSAQPQRRLLPRRRTPGPGGSSSTTFLAAPMLRLGFRPPRTESREDGESGGAPPDRDGERGGAPPGQV